MKPRLESLRPALANDRDAFRNAWERTLDILGSHDVNGSDVAWYRKVNRRFLPGGVSVPASPDWERNRPPRRIRDSRARRHVKPVHAGLHPRSRMAGFPGRHEREALPHASRWVAFAALFLVLASSLLAADAASRPGKVVFSTDFDSANALAPWGGPTPGVSLDTGRLGAAMRISRRVAEGPGTVAVSTPLSEESLRGGRVRCEAMVRADNVAQPSNAWNGIKVMLHTVSPSEAKRWDQQNHVFGTFPWRRVQFSTWVPADATLAQLTLGLEATSGQVWFDDVKVTVLRDPRDVAPDRPPAGPAFKGHDQPRLRGAMVHPDLSPESLRVLPLCRQHGMRVAIDLHWPPGGARTASGYIGSDTGLFTNAAAQLKFVEVWQRLARRYRDDATVWGYDLANEPVEEAVADDCVDWQELATRAARAIRAIDGRHAIIVEPSPWGGPDAIRNLDPVPVEGVVYSVHMYGWSVEHGDQPNDSRPASVPTDRQRLLLDWFARSARRCRSFERCGQRARHPAR